VQEFAMQPHGLVLVTGPAGSGKSTTLAARIEHINSHRSAHIICLEDPIEYLHAHKQSLIEQREIYEDAPSFAHALQAVFRQSPDVIMVGEMRDLPTISTAITAAETGHLVIGTLHTLDAAQSVDRVIDLFPADQQHQIRLQFSQVVLAVLSQILLNRVGGGRIAAFEIMLATPMIRKFIREGNTGEIPANLEMGASEGKQSLDQAMAELVRRGLVAREEALLASSHPAHLADLLDAGP
jgi:twitching motility protein PilT